MGYRWLGRYIEYKGVSIEENIIHSFHFADNKPDDLWKYTFIHREIR